MVRIFGSRRPLRDCRPDLSPGCGAFGRRISSHRERMSGARSLAKLGRLAAAVLFCLFAAGAGWALQPDEVLLIANRHVPAGTALAREYQQSRSVPSGHLLLVDLPVSEDCSRSVYRRELLQPLRKALARPENSGIRCVLLLYGIPLRVAAPDESGQATETTPSGERRRQSAAVDSELALARCADCPLAGWLKNPLYAGFRPGPRKPRIVRDQVLMVARLDGPSPAVVRRMLADSLSAERKGLRGTAYFDARRPLSGTPLGPGYARYDEQLHQAAETVRRSGLLPVVLDQQERLLERRELQAAAALYAGWYRLGRYADVFSWQPGAVGYHVASSACETLKVRSSQVWCKRLLEEGVAATLGPVAEPYVQGFPRPDLFFGYLLEGYYSLAESYFMSLPYLSWQMILVGDPLYRPFRAQVTGTR